MSAGRYAARLLAFLLLLAALACGDSGKSDITVFAAASLANAFAELAEAYEGKHPERSVRLNFDGSQRLRTQLEHGARADVFASADWEQMQAVADAGLLTGEPANFAVNELIVLVNTGFFDANELRDDSAAGITRLAEPGVKIVLALEEAPVGRYAAAFLNQASASPNLGPEIADGFRANVVSREANVRSVAQKVALGEADAGITYRTDARPDEVARNTIALEIPESLNVSAEYPIAALSDSEAAAGFIEFVLSEPGREILANNGFGPPPAIQSAAP